ncbi:MAG: amidohydrolase family protein [Syntrophaceae bacterium]|nr:amidohydrolase family protein [Syntrophaceae bacterium]
MMKKRLCLPVLSILLCLMFPFSAMAQSVPDPDLVAAIAGIKAIDNHAHPLRVLKEGERDTEWGELSYHTLSAATSDPSEEIPLVPFRLRPESPEYVAVWKELYGVSLGRVPKEFIREVIRTKKRIMREQGDNYPAWVLDKIGVETMLANRTAMDRSLPATRFRWVPYADALMFPLSNQEAKVTRPDLASSYEGLERLRASFLKDLGISRLPSSLKDYLSMVVTPSLERQKQGGAVAVKFLTAYLRPLEVSNPSAEQAGRVYEGYVRGGKPTGREYGTLQDYLFRYICREAGRLGMAVHIHTGFGIGQYFDVVGSNPLLLESVFNDPDLRKTRFVIIHGGWPFAKQTAAMLLKPNVYADFSAIDFLLYPREVGDVLRSWLEIAPDKVLFGTDGFELDPNMLFVNWEEFSCLGTRSARQALALALTDMKQDGEITHEEALVIARKVLRENAIRIYGLVSR